MNRDTYPLASNDNLTFYFESVSERAIVTKVVVFTPVFEDADIFYLGFGDVQPDGTIDDLVVTNNQDFEKVLATVIRTVVLFLGTFSDKKVFFEGSTPARNRLYQIIINKEHETIKEHFIVEGLTKTGFEVYTKNTNYEGFIVSLKTNNNEKIN